MSPDQASAVLDAWRDLSAGNRTAATYVALVDAMPADDPDNRAAAIAALVRGITPQAIDLAGLARATAEALGVADPPKRRSGPDPSAVILDELLGWENPSAN